MEAKPIELSGLDVVIIKQQLIRCTNEQIAEIIDKPLYLVKEKIKHLATLGHVRPIPKIKKVKPKKVEDLEKKRRAEERQAVLQHQRNIEASRLAAKKALTTPQFKMKQVDYSQLVLVKIDSKTSVYAKPGEDIKEVRKRYFANNAKALEQRDKVKN